MPSPDRQSLFRQMGRNKSLFDSTSKQRYSNMLWNMRSITRHKRSYGHPLHTDLTPDVLTCVLPLGIVSSGRESEVESAHLFLTIIQFLSACHLTSQHTSLMTLRLPLSGNKHATIVSAYAPTMTNPDEVKDKFYDDLDNIISATPRTDKLILLGDFNARVGTDHQTLEGVIGSEGVGKCNRNGLLLLRKCA